MIPLSAIPTSQSGQCPVSKTKGKRIDTATVKCQLSVSLEKVQSGQYFFCRDAECPVVYFHEAGEQVFNVTDIREHVYQKETDNESVLICYCFQFTLGQVREAFKQTEKNRIVEAIEAGIQAGQCACDWRNPQGNCCLGNVQALGKGYRTP